MAQEGALADVCGRHTSSREKKKGLLLTQHPQLVNHLGRAATGHLTYGKEASSHCQALGTCAQLS